MKGFINDIVGTCFKNAILALYPSGYQILLNKIHLSIMALWGAHDVILPPPPIGRKLNSIFRSVNLSIKMEML